MAWMNDRPSPSTPEIKEKSQHVEELVHRELSLYFLANGEVPREIRMNPWSIFDMTKERWHSFPFWAEDRIVFIPVIPSAAVPVGRIHCVGSEETVKREAVRA